jgi:growth arrest-specific protein 8
LETIQESLETKDA